VLVGENHTILRSHDGGRHFELVDQGAHHTLDAVLVLKDGQYLTAGEDGIRLDTPKGRQS
jgi:photosystem II stability/assembly factor-like uncharacterized protein